MKMIFINVSYNFFNYICYVLKQFRDPKLNVVLLKPSGHHINNKKIVYCLTEFSEVNKVFLVCGNPE